MLNTILIGTVPLKSNTKGLWLFKVVLIPMKMESNGDGGFFLAQPLLKV